jgi:hypothetical protein
MTIDFDSLNVFQKFASYIPWFSTKIGNYSIIVQPAEKGKKAGELSPQELKDEAIDGFIEFYLPEFYPFLYDEGQEKGGYGDTYQTIRSSISNNLEYVKKDPESSFPKYLFSSAPGNLNFKKIRLGLLTHGLADEQKYLKKLLVEDSKPRTAQTTIPENSCLRMILECQVMRPPDLFLMINKR